ncbi:flavodoxin [Enterococcus plantarum]|uniref:flavodoxin n=1 Tax=Enterococcus plantarum TaxID=1077675 RepID=UPI00084DFBF6|nr:flavodoxin [Enterococcus plantarum]OEG12602.1 flavodoxin [Enterococcus plantarum]
MTAIVYFSRAFENLIDGEKENLHVGNTKIVAQKIAEILDTETIELIPKTAYPKKYQAVFAQAEQEKIMNERPKYKPISLNLEKHQTIYLGYPNWWGTFPMIVATFLEKNDLSGKNIYPFCTHEGSGMGNSIHDLQQLCSNANIHIGLPIRGSRVEKADIAIKNWLQHE